MAAQNPYNRAYYEARGAGGRISFWFYYRLARRYVGDGRVLDYGCGCGHYLKYFSRKHYETYGYDISPDALGLARENAVCGHLFSDREALPTGSFDLVASIHVLEHIDQPIETLRFIAALLKGGGVLLYVVPNISGIGHKLKKNNWIGFGDPAHISLYPAGQWTGLTEEAGFTVLEVGTDGLWDVPYIEGVALFIQKLIFYPVPALQVLAGRLILPPRWGESLVVIARKKD
ncbi:MAG: class I SAM-dependent methyltransferase [Nitrospirae bacterium]|nr:class I SAM-dependent methyltransferase [Nitrospirota bacterium]